MKTPPLITILIAAFTLSLSAKEVALDKCPKEVQTTITKNLKAGTLNEVELKTVRGTTLYVADIDLPNRRDLKIYVEPNGALLKTEEEITFSELPTAVKATVKSKQGQGKIGDVDRVTFKKSITYLVEIDFDGVPDLKLTIAADGKIIEERKD